MDCITISDSSLIIEELSSTASAPIIIHSNTTDRCTDTRKSKQKPRWSVTSPFRNINETDTMLKNRVNVWLETSLPLAEQSPESYYKDSDSLDAENNSNNLDDYYRKPRHFEDLPKRNILIRHDYDKQDDIVSNVRPYKPKLRYNSNDRIASGREYPNSSNKSINPCIIPQLENEVINTENCKQQQKVNNNENCKQQQKVNNNEVPLSPESQKKNELCSYLQLMNMNKTDKKIGDKIQNRRSTRVKNLMILSKKKELERKLNIEAMEKQKDEDKQEKDDCIEMPSYHKENDLPTTYLSEAVEKQKEENKQDKDDCLKTPSYDSKNNSSTKSLNEMHAKEKDLDNVESESSSQRHFFNASYIPRDILEKCSDFDDAIMSFISARDISVMKDVHLKKDKTKGAVTALQDSKEDMTKPKEHMNGTLNKSSLSNTTKSMSSRISTRSTFTDSKSSKQKKQQNDDLKKKISSMRQDSLTLKNNYRRMLFRYGSRQNLRSKVSLSNVGIKTLLIKDKRHRQIRKKKKRQTQKNNISKTRLRTRNQRITRNLNLNNQKHTRRTIHTESKKETAFINRKKQLRTKLKETVNNQENIKAKLENTEERIKSKQKLSEITPEKVKTQIETKNKDTTDVNKIVKDVQVIIKDVLMHTPVIKQKFNSIKENENQIKLTSSEELNSKINSLNSEQNKSIIKQKDVINTSETEIKIDKANKESKTNYKEKAFNVINLSHSKSSLAVNILNEHDYCLKQLQNDQGYIMNVVLGTSEKSPVTETVEDKAISDDIYCKTPELLSGCKDAEYGKEILEEIIGIPWRHSHCKIYKNIDENYTNKNDNEESKEPTEIQTHTPNQYKYGSYHDSLLPNSNNSSKLFNMRLPLLEPPSNIFDEGSCSPQNDQSQETLQSKTENISSNDVSGKPRRILMSVPSEVKSLHKSLMHGKSKVQMRHADLYGESSNHTWDNDNTCEEKRSHSIKISNSNGDVMNAFYIDFNLVIVQEQMVSFWCQSPLGNMLGSQNMWIDKGSVQRLISDSNCLYKESFDMVISLENSFAYVELWTKEHKSDKRQRPRADVFVTVYFWWFRQNAPDKKVLQLETINGNVSDVQYIVLRNSRNIVVSWLETKEEMKKTVVNCYCFAPDYQTVLTVRKMDAVHHYVSSLHNIEDSSNIIMGFGEENITLWNLEYGYVVATIEMKNTISANPRCVWTKCDRGFLFVLQYHQLERVLALLAVNGNSHSWKRLQVFRAPHGYDGLRGVCIDNNVLAAFYQRGVLCWNIQTGESVIEEMTSQTSYLACDKHIIMFNSEKVQVQQFLSYFITSFDLQ